MQAQIASFFDPITSTASHVVYDQAGGHAAVIDPVLDYDAAAGRISTTGADTIAAFVQAHDLKVQWLLETHAHADHLSASAYLKRTLGGRIGIGVGGRRIRGQRRQSAQRFPPTRQAIAVVIGIYRHVSVRPERDDVRAAA